MSDDLTDDLTRAIAEALVCRPGGIYDRDESPPQPIGTWCVRHGRPHVSQWPCPESERIAAALAPLIEARAREARAEGAAGALLSFMHEAECDADANHAALRSGQWHREVSGTHLAERMAEEEDSRA